MPAEGLQGKKFTGKVVEGFDPQQRGRYYVHVPDVMPHIPESEGFLCRNSTHSGRVGDCNAGTAGQSYPLHPGDQVEIVCVQDDLSSMEICRKVSDDKPKSDSGAGKLMGAEPSGKVVPCVISGLPEDIPFGSTNSDIIGQFTEILNSGGKMAQDLLNSVKDKLGDTFNKLAENFKSLDIPSVIEENFNNAMQDVQKAIEDNAGGIDQWTNSIVDNIPIISPDDIVSEAEQLMGTIGTEDEVIDKVLKKKEPENRGETRNAR